MKFINEIETNQEFKEYYLCKEKQEKKTKTGKDYLRLVLMDKTGTISANVWELSSVISEFEPGNIVQIQARVEEYGGTLQLNIAKIRRAAAGEYNPKNYILTTEKDIDEMQALLDKFIDSVQNDHLNQLLTNVFIKNEAIRESFQKHSAAKNKHHSYVGGLLEHSLAVAEICEFLASRYNGVNRDLLITAALLHDIGKLYELEATPGSDFTNEGKLIGHITIGYELVSGEIACIEGFASDLRSLLLHCILAHHGDLEFGSPVVPKTIEAAILSNADRTDAHVKQFDEIISKIKPGDIWSAYDYTWRREMRRGL